MNPPYLHHTHAVTGHARTHRSQNCSLPSAWRHSGTESCTVHPYRRPVPDRATRHPPADVQVDRTSLLRACRRRAVAAQSAAPHPDSFGPVPARCSCTACARCSGQREIYERSQQPGTDSINSFFGAPSPHVSPHAIRAAFLCPLIIRPAESVGPSGAQARAVPTPARLLYNMLAVEPAAVPAVPVIAEGLLGRRTSAAQVPLVDAHRPSDSRLADNRACAIRLKGVLVLRQHPIARARWLVDGKLKAALPLPVGILL